MVLLTMGCFQLCLASTWSSKLGLTDLNQPCKLLCECLLVLGQMWCSRAFPERLQLLGNTHLLPELGSVRSRLRKHLWERTRKTQSPAGLFSQDRGAHVLRDPSMYTFFAYRLSSYPHNKQAGREETDTERNSCYVVRTDKGNQEVL